jgi:hypothetical protein
MTDEPRPDNEDLQNLLAALVEQVRALAARLTGNADQPTVCHFCGGPLPLWENLLVLQLTGVAAHVECPKDLLEARLHAVGPEPGFPYTELSASVERRLSEPATTFRSGTIER